MYQELSFFTNKQELEYLLKLLQQERKQNCECQLQDVNRNLRIEISIMLDKFKQTGSSKEL